MTPVPAPLRSTPFIRLTGPIGFAALAGLAAGLLLGAGGFAPRTPPAAAAPAVVPVAYQTGGSPKAGASKAEADGPPRRPVVSVRDLRPERTVGLLGEPLGTVVAVRGEAFEGTREDGKANFGRTLLRIRSVNDRPLERPVVFREYLADPKPVVGATFHAWGHEQGGFHGWTAPPEGVSERLREKHWPDIAHDGFWFRPELVLHAPVE